MFLNGLPAEEDLIRKAGEGERRAFESLMNLHLKTLYNYIRLHVPNEEDIKDIVQESMLAAWLGLKEFAGRSSFKTWLMGIVRRKTADHFRAAYKSQAISISGFEDILTDKSEPEDIIPKLDIENALSGLSKAERELVFLTFTAGLTYPEISEVLGIPVGTVKSRMSAIKGKLRDKLK